MSCEMTSLERGGVLAVNKPSGMTSHDVVNIIRKIYGTKKVGHTGTLDPMASGVLVILVGRAVKATEYISSSSKKYRATLRLGLTTDTEDVTGNTLTTCDRIPDPDALQKVLPSFRGKIRQIPPMYSALKVGGKKLVDLAREGKVIERQPREIEIFALDAVPTEEKTDYILDVSCSGGTYIRTLCADIGAALGCGGVMATLERREACGFSIAQAHTVAELEELTLEERQARLIPTESLFASLPAIKLPSFYERLCRSGCEIYLNKIKASHEEGQRIRLCTESGEFFALGEVFSYEKGLAVKAIKTFELE